MTIELAILEERSRILPKDAEYGTVIPLTDNKAAQAELRWIGC